ncbi:SPX domain-containing protein [Chaetomium strumarium]|uniref:SPX domain-containing protein n=1 Tax=Chaetomium strumarium TaxID=1170767 RepID=A0AAJ0GSK7_9PEZI|nr:SPX domain-containing protein [Chaetomium strumarium]
MKYGEQFERESVPQWSLHNIDYNSLKHHIKAHTTKDQATAIAIPGRPNTALRKFEDDFYAELCRQHDRVDLFVTSKADEIARRIQHLSGQIHRLILRCATSGRDRIPLKRQSRFAKYEQTLLQCGDDIKALQRFVNAQIVAFRKILKKYRKWTGSSTLGSRFRDNVLSHPKSFTKRDFSQLHTQYMDLLGTLRAALPTNPDGRITMPSTEAQPSRPPTADLSPSETIVAPEPPPNVGYWNEYDYGSEAGDVDRNGDGEYAIYIDPNEDSSLAVIKGLAAFFATPFTKLSAWISPRTMKSGEDTERSALLHTHSTGSHYDYGSNRSVGEGSYFATPPGGRIGIGTETDGEDDLRSTAYPSNRHSRRTSVSNRDYTSCSDDQQFPSGYSAYRAAYVLPSIPDQRVARYRERVLLWGTLGCFAASFLLMAIATLLITTGRHKMRLEVDAGATLGIVASLGAACAGLCMTGSRRDKVSLLYRLAVWVAFAGSCVLNGVLLVMVMGNTAI